MTKSIEIEFHFQVGIPKCLNSPSGESNTYSHILYSLSLHYCTKSIGSGLHKSLFLLDILNIECLQASSKIRFFLSLYFWEHIDDYEISTSYLHAKQM